MAIRPSRPAIITDVALQQDALQPVEPVVDSRQLVVDAVEPLVHLVESPIDLVEASIHFVKAPIDLIEAAIRMGREVIESLVGPALPHGLHDDGIVDRTTRAHGALNRNLL